MFLSYYSHDEKQPEVIRVNLNKVAVKAWRLTYGTDLKPTRIYITYHDIMRYSVHLPIERVQHFEDLLQYLEEKHPGKRLKEEEKAADRPPLFILKPGNNEKLSEKKD